MRVMFFSPSFGEGSFFDVSPHIRLLSPKEGDHISLDYDLGVRWKYYGPLEDFPRGWRVEGRRPGEETPTFTRTFRCQSPTDVPAEHVLLGYPTRTCGENVGPIPDGDYTLRIIGGSFSDETEGTFHFGASDDWPHIELLNPTPGSGDVVFKGDNIQVKFIVRPDDAPVVLRIKKGEVTVYSDNVNPSSSSGCGDAEFGSRLCEKTIPINDSFETGRDYKVVVSSRPNPEARNERGLFIIFDRPLGPPIDPDAVDIRLGDLRVNEDGHLQVNFSVVTFGASIPDRYSLLRFLVGKREIPVGRDSPRYVPSGGVVVERNVPTSGATWIDLGHVDRFVTAAERRSHHRMNFSVMVNISPPYTVPERNYDNNTFVKSLPIRRTYVTHVIPNPSVCYYESDGRYDTNYEVGSFHLRFNNWGYAPATGRIGVMQTAREAPGELAGGTEERNNLGQKEITVPITTGSDAYMRGIFGSGVSLPLWRNGELEIRFFGDLGLYQDTIRVPFEYRRR